MRSRYNTRAWDWIEYATKKCAANIIHMRIRNVHFDFKLFVEVTTEAVGALCC